MKNTRKKYKIKNVITTHIVNNKKEYIIMLLLLLIGILLGVMVVNNSSEEQFNNISSYINNFVEKLKNIQNIDSIGLLKNSAIENSIFAIIIWFFGTTVIRNSCSFWNCCL